jgi:hypothetical protein
MAPNRYHSYITRSLDAFVGGDSKNIGPQYPIIAASLVPIFLLLICFKSLKHVSYFATFGIFIIMSTCIGLVTYGLAVVCNGVTACGDVHYAKIETAPILIGILTFSMEGIYVLPAVYDSMRDPRKVARLIQTQYHLPPTTNHIKTNTSTRLKRPPLQTETNHHLNILTPVQFGIVLDLAYATATAVSAVFGMCAYYIWGPETAAVVATNLPRYSTPLFYN